MFDIAILLLLFKKIQVSCDIAEENSRTSRTTFAIVAAKMYIFKKLIPKHL